MINFKSLCFILLLIPNLLMGQSERDQKINKKSDRNKPTTTVVVTESQTVYQNNSYYPPLNPYNPYNPYNNRGFRNGYYENNYNSNIGNNNFFSKKRSDNSTPRNSNIRLGFIGGLSDPTSLGLFTTIGNKMFLYLSYEGSPSSTYEHYDNISFEEVMNWGDEQRDTFETYTSFSVGFGGEVTDKLSQFAGININTINKDLVFYDELLILSNNGEYSINDTEKTNFSLVYGLIFDMNKLSVGPSIYFLNRTRFNINLGFNF